MSELDRERILGAMGAVGLDSESLACLNVTSVQADTVIAAAKTWYFEQEASLNSARSSICEARYGWHAARKALRTGSAGPEGEAALAAAVETLKSAQQAGESLLASLRSVLAAEMSESQLPLWTVVEANRGRALPILALTDEQAGQLRDADHTMRSDVADAASGAERQSARVAWGVSVDNLLTGVNDELIDSYESYESDSTANVVAAIESVLVTE